MYVYWLSYTEVTEAETRPDSMTFCGTYETFAEGLSTMFSDVFDETLDLLKFCYGASDEDLERLYSPRSLTGYVQVANDLFAKYDGDIQLSFEVSDTGDICIRREDGAGITEYHVEDDDTEILVKDQTHE